MKKEIHFLSKAKVPGAWTTCPLGCLLGELVMWPGAMQLFC